MSEAWTGDFCRLENPFIVITSRWIWYWRKLFTAQWNTWNQWNKTALLLREKRKKSNKIQSPIKETYNNSNHRAVEVSVRPLNSICLTKTKVHCSWGSRHHKPLTGRGCCWRKDIRSFWSISVYSVTDRAIFYWYFKGKNSLYFPLFFLPCWRNNSKRDSGSSSSKTFSSVHSIHTGSGSRQPPVEFEPGALSSEVKPMEHEANHLKQVLSSRWWGDLPPLLHVFMTWCLIWHGAHFNFCSLKQSKKVPYSNLFHECFCSMENSLLKSKLNYWLSDSVTFLLLCSPDLRTVVNTYEICGFSFCHLHYCGPLRILCCVLSCI